MPCTTTDCVLVGRVSKGRLISKTASDLIESAALCRQMGLGAGLFWMGDLDESEEADEPARRVSLEDRRSIAGDDFTARVNRIIEETAGQ